MKLKIILLVALLPWSFCFAQKDYKYSTKSKKAIRSFKKAASSYDYKKYDEALGFLSDALIKDEDFIEAHMMMGDVYADMKDFPNSVAHYKRAVEINPGFFPQNFFNLAKSEMHIEKYEDAKMHLEKFLTLNKISPALKMKAEKMLTTCVFGAEQVRHPVPFNPINMGDSINTAAKEYLPMLTADEQNIVFTRMKPKPVQRQSIGSSNLEEDFYTADKINGVWEMARPLGPPINTPLNEGGQCLSPDGKTIYFTGCDRPEGLGSCDIYYSKKTGSSWSEPLNLGSRVNSKEWDSQPTISFDGSTLYFTSNRQGGSGGTDIWKTLKGPDGSWGTAINLGPVINTTGNENSPFIHTDNQTLYFSSNGHPGMGDADLFLSRLGDDQQWGTPVNLGYPLNTSGEEFSLFVSTDGKTGYFSSERLKGFGSLDLFSFDMYPAIRPNVVSYVTGVVTDESGKNFLEAKFEIIDNETGKIIVNSFSDKVNGSFLVCLPSGKDYGLNVAKDNYLFYSDHFSCKDPTSTKNAYVINIKLKPAKAGEKVVLKNIFFETNSFELKSESFPEIGKLISFLNANPKIKIEISGHTDNSGDVKNNQALSEKRARSVYDYIVKSGIAAARLSYKGYGETKPVADNSTEEGKALNRRTEFAITQVD
jgi:outer membrane protein OmpA-like peptidoglycan-associated protein